jgi:hypothetical protein
MNVGAANGAMEGRKYMNVGAENVFIHFLFICFRVCLLVG